MSSKNGLQCGACLKDIIDKNYIKCCIDSCKVPFHRDLCIGPSPPEDVRKWVCQKCRCSLKKGGDNTETPVKASSTSVNVTIRNKNKASTSIEKSPELENSSLGSLIAEIRFLRQDVSQLTDKVTEIFSALTQCCERLSEVENHMTRTDQRLKLLEEREAEVASLQCQVHTLQDQLSNQAQAALRNEIELVGIPETSSENLSQIATVLATKIGVVLNETDVDWVTRVGLKRAPGTGKSLPRPIVIRCVRRGKRDEILRAGKSRKNLSTQDLPIKADVQKIFINERLTSEKRKLFRESRSRASNAGYKYCWTQNGNVFIRKREGSSAIQIRSQAEMAEKLAVPENN
ncbi:uncharacterized protein LOC128201797 [Galleria mellonella]|uniref:Uncharacterized protein LOC128201797 n=1 Tax=Galleria mellonella TaxID=7137 RepID=A0ABM3MWM2_GALME|nr:uncharacterized protein LOC128201797 [Galleria mellonella]